MSSDLRNWTNDLRKRDCFSEKEIDEPVLVLNITPSATKDGSFSVVETPCSTKDELEGLLTEESRLDYKVRVYSICQKRSYSRLYMTEEMFKRVMNVHDVTNDFCELVSCFRHTTDHRTGEACCGPQLRRATKQRSEIAYIFKYPESNGRTDGVDPWSLRQTAVYYQYNHQSQQATWILINPYPRSPAWKNLVAYFNGDLLTITSSHSHLGGHNAILSSYLSNWKPYLLYYEETVSAISSTLLGTKIRHTIDYNYDTLGRLRYIQARCIPLKSIFSSYWRALTELSDLATATPTQQPLQTQAARSAPTWIATHEQKVAAYSDHSDALMAQSEFAVQLLRDRLSFKDQRVLQQQSNSVLELTQLTVDDSATVRVITVITLAYLVFTVIATIMELPFFHLGESAEDLKVSSQIWIYIVISVPLTLLTIGYWKLAMWLNERKRESRRKTLAQEEKELA